MSQEKEQLEIQPPDLVRLDVVWFVRSHPLAIHLIVLVFNVVQEDAGVRIFRLEVVLRLEQQVFEHFSTPVVSGNVGKTFRRLDALWGFLLGRHL